MYEDGLLWQIEEVPAYRNENMAADPLYEIPRLILVGRDQTWLSIGSDYYSSIQSLLDYDEDILSLVNQIAQKILSDEQRIRNISEYVQQSISYTAIEFGARGYTPKSPSSTLQDLYGDCKDHAVILSAMLKAAGLSSRLVLVNLDQPVLPDLPSLDQFDHMIVEAKTTDKLYYLDATDKDLPLLKYPPRYLAGNMGLALGSNPEQVFIPPYPADSRRISSVRVVELDKNGYMRVNEILTADGYAAAAYRGDLSNRSSLNRRDRIQEYLNSYGDHLKLKDLVIMNIENNQLPLIIDLTYETTAIPLNLPGFIPDVPSIFELQWIPPTWYESRQTDFKVEYPLQFTADITLIDNSSANTFTHTLEPVSMQTRFGNWELSATPDSGQLAIRFHYNEHAATYSAEHYEEYETFSSTAVRVLTNAGRLSQPSSNGQIITSR
ncbi:MAG: transglutaminase domain-containing protein [Gammaproteobacteria bacterium]|nr:transglutaminase domain-containing protein [Gammaproteobacteria bacterium]